MKISFSPPDIGEREIELVVETLKSGWITTGPKTKKFENELKKYCNVDNVVCLNSATAALELTLRLLGIGEGDEVITSAYTYTASASVICHVGAKVVLVDTQKDNLEMDYAALENAITEKTKAIIPVDLAGCVCDYEKIYKVIDNCKNKFKAVNDIQKAIGRLVVLTDGAHGLGATRNGKKCGTFGDFTAFSFHAVKNLTTGEGGAIAWNNIAGVDNAKMYKQYQLMSLHGQNKDALEKTKLDAWEYDIVAPWYKCNMTDVAAAMGLAQLERYDSLLLRRKQIVKMYNDLFKGSRVSYLDHTNSSNHLYIANIQGISEEDRNNIIREMANKGIATNVHYKPLPMFTAYKNLGFDIKNYPNAFNHYKNEITLPLHTLLSDEDVQYIAKSLLEIVKCY